MAAEALQVQSARAEDVPLILEFIRGMAEYEKLASECVATEELLRKNLFGERPAAEVLLAYLGGEAVGFALFFQNFSTFLARPGIYLEDIFVKPHVRRRGVGSVLLREVAKLAVERGGGRVEWSALDWNTPAIDFYLKIGARKMDEWTTFRLTGEALVAFARSGKR